MSDTSSDLPGGRPDQSCRFRKFRHSLARGGARGRPGRMSAASTVAPRWRPPAPGVCFDPSPVEIPSGANEQQQREGASSPRSYLLGAMPSAKETPVKPDPTLVR